MSRISTFANARTHAAYQEARHQLAKLKEELLLLHGRASTDGDDKLTIERHLTRIEAIKKEMYL